MNQEKVGLFIKNIRIKNDLTQKQLANKLNVTYQAVSKWERGLNVPDIAIMMEISKLFNVDISEIISGEVKNNNKRKNKLVYLIVIVVIFFIFLFFIFYKNGESNFEFKKISSDCDNFELTGSAAYSKDISSLYISNVSYCGSQDNTVYEELECNLFEDNKLIRTCEVGNDLTLQDFLKNVKISVNDYKSSCNDFVNSNLYLEIRARDEENKETVYNIPISLNDNCDAQP